jgi:hypothetical protein
LVCQKWGFVAIRSFLLSSSFDLLLEGFAFVVIMTLSTKALPLWFLCSSPALPCGSQHEKPSPNAYDSYSSQRWFALLMCHVEFKISSVSLALEPPFGGHVHFIYLRFAEGGEGFSQTAVRHNFK